MWYSIVATDVAASLALRQRVRCEHLARIQVLLDQGKLLVAGPNPAIDTPQPAEFGFSGSIIIAAFASLAQAQQWADNDPYVTAGVYENVMVQPFLPVLPAQYSTEIL